MQRTYLRPLGLAYGPDAIRAVEQGRAGRLGGSGWISFNAAEVITRTGEGISRDVVDYGDLHHDAALAAIEVRREAVAGLELERPLIMGIVNVTPDSFSDGGLAADTKSAIAHGLRLAEEGAHVLDLGGESTRPGSEGVGIEEELARVIPVITALAKSGHPISCDTRKAEVMGEAIRAVVDTVRMGGTEIPVEIIDSRAALRKAAQHAQTGAVELKSPMPGKIVRVQVKVGDEVTEGQGLVVVEAMKMENELKSPKAGKVTELHAVEGAAVESGAKLVVVS